MSLPERIDSCKSALEYIKTELYPYEKLNNFIPVFITRYETYIENQIDLISSLYRSSPKEKKAKCLELLDSISMSIYHTSIMIMPLILEMHSARNLKKRNFQISKENTSLVKRDKMERKMIKEFPSVAEAYLQYLSMLVLCGADNKLIGKMPRINKLQDLDDHQTSDSDEGLTNI